MLLPQTISAIASIPNKTPDAAPFTIVAPTSTSALPVTLSVKSGPAVINGASGGTYTVTLNGTTGTVVIAANQSGNDSYSASEEVTTSFVVSYISQSISSLPILDNRIPSSSSFSVISPSSSSGLPVTLSIKSGPATISGTAGGTYTATLTRQEGTVVIAANQSGNGSYSPAEEKTTSFIVSKLNQVITSFNNIPDQTPSSRIVAFAPPYATSRLPVNIYISSGSALISGNNILLNGQTGVISISASQSGNIDFYPAQTVATSFSVRKLSQSISNFILPNSVCPLTGFSLTRPIATSNLPVSISVVSGDASITGNNIYIGTGLSPVVLSASQTGDSYDYFAAPSISGVLNINKVPQILTLEQIPDQYINTQSVPIKILASGASNNPVILNVSSPATLANNSIYFNGLTGKIELSGYQSGNSQYEESNSVSLNFNVFKLSQIISDISGISGKLPSSLPFTVNAPSSTSSLPVSLGIQSGPASITGTAGGQYVISLSGVTGTVVISATQTGNDIFDSVTKNVSTFSITYLSQNILGISGITNKTPGSAPFSINAPSATSSLPVGLSIKSGPADISGTAGGVYTIALSGTTGNVVVAANQSGNSSYISAQEVTTSFLVTYLTQTISGISPINAKTPDAIPFNINAPVSTSLLPVNLSIKSGPATINENSSGVYTITLSGTTGTVTVAANQSGDSNYTPASEITTAFNVDYLPQTIYTLPIISDKVPSTQSFTLSAPISDSSLPVTLSIKSGPATTTGTPGGLYDIILSGVTGLVVLAANQTGNSSYAPAQEITTSFNIAKSNQYISSFSIADQSNLSGSITGINVSSSSSLPVVLTVQSGPASAANNIITLSGSEGVITVAANQSGNIDYNPAQTVTSSFRAVKTAYSFEVITNNFFYQNFPVSGLGSQVSASGLPDGLYFNNADKSIYGSSDSIGNFKSYILNTGLPSGYIGINFNIVPPKNTGYLYAFGPGLGYGENAIPTKFSKFVYTEILAKNKYNLAISSQTAYVPPPPVVVVPPPVPVTPSTLLNTTPYSFIITNNSREDCIDDFTFISTITGNYSGYLDNSLSFGYEGGSPGASSVASIVTSGYEM
jgi:hypothetical protein